MSFLTSLRPTTRLATTFSTPLRTFNTSPASRAARMTIVGRLADTPEINATSTGQDVIRYALATSSGPRDNQQTSWWRVSAFIPEGGLRDRMLGMGKGSLVYLEGDCKMDKFTGKDGNPQSSVSIVQRNIEILDRRGGEGPPEGQSE